MNTQVITGHLVLIMGPTGSGKSSIVNFLLRHFSELRYSISCTTRTPRPGEVYGIEYYFITREDFEQKIARGEFLEWAEFSGNLYGTLRSEVVDKLTAGQVLITEIELQGVQQLMKLIPKEHRTVVFVEAGDWQTLRERALARSPMSEAELALRHERYLIEIQSKPFADVIIDNSNGHIDAANEEMSILIKSIIKNLAITRKS